jgi:hypothetical protein
VVTSFDLEHPITRWTRLADRAYDRADRIIWIAIVLMIACVLYAFVGLLVLVDQGSPHEARLIRVIVTAPVIVNPQSGVTYVAKDGVVAEGQLRNGLIIQQPISLQERDAGHFTVYTRASNHRLEVSSHPLPAQRHHRTSSILAVIISALLLFCTQEFNRRAGRIW